MKKLLFLLLISVGLFAQPYIQQISWYSDGKSANWAVPPSGGTSSNPYIDTTLAYRSVVLNLTQADSCNLQFFSEDTLTAKLYVFSTDARTFSDSSTTVVDSLKFLGASGTFISWSKIVSALNALSVAGRNYYQPYMLRFTLVFYTSGTTGNPHSAFKTRYKKFKTYVKYFK